jgi:large subunit ribosomal protein L17
MRHGKKNNHLSRPASHRKALLANQAKSLILHKRIITTVAKAKALRKFIEPIITKSKVDSTHTRRTVFSYFQDKEPVKILFDEIVHKIGDRPGGYTRIIKTGTRLGDNSEMCMMELVDYNELFQKETKSQKVRTRRGTGKAKTSESVDQDSQTITQQETASKKAVVEENETVNDNTTSSADQEPGMASSAENIEA